jgi:hypothetical protein
VHRQQSNETFRALELLNMTYYGSNQTVGLLSPLLNNFYINEVNPMPEIVRGYVAEPLERMMSIYQQGDNAWTPDPRPNPTIARNPFDILEEVQPLLAQSYNRPMFWCFDDIGLSPILPVLENPEGLNERYQVELALRDELQPLSLTSAFPAEAEGLLGFPPVLAPALPLPVIEIPFAPVEPPVLTSLDDLREESFDFMSRIWDLSPCEDCVPALSFGQ